MTAVLFRGVTLKQATRVVEMMVVVEEGEEKEEAEKELRVDTVHRGVMADFLVALIDFHESLAVIK